VFENIVEKHKNEDGAINWKNLGTMFCLSEAIVPIGPKKALFASYYDNMLKASKDTGKLSKAEFLNVRSWFDLHLSMNRKEELEYEEDKEEVD
jgi:hypothetical protein